MPNAAWCASAGARCLPLAARLCRATQAQAAAGDGAEELLAAVLALARGVRRGPTAAREVLDSGAVPLLARLESHPRAAVRAAAAEALSCIASALWG